MWLVGVGFNIRVKHVIFPEESQIYEKYKRYVLHDLSLLPSPLWSHFFPPSWRSPLQLHWSPCLSSNMLCQLGPRPYICSFVLLGNFSLRYAHDSLTPISSRSYHRPLPWPPFIKQPLPIPTTAFSITLTYLTFFWSIYYIIILSMHFFLYSQPLLLEQKRLRSRWCELVHCLSSAPWMVLCFLYRKLIFVNK